MTDEQQDKFAPNHEVVEGFVRYCPCCGKQWANSGDTNEEITCGWDDCGAKFKVLKV